MAEETKIHINTNFFFKQDNSKYFTAKSAKESQRKEK